MLELEKTTTPEVTVVPYKIRMRVCELLDANEIPYKQISQDDPDEFRDGWPTWIIYCGKEYTDNNHAFVTTVTSKSLFKAAEDMHGMTPKQIREYVAAQKNIEAAP
jgi:hypothetical protein